MKHMQGKLKMHDTEQNVVAGEDHKTIADVNTISRSKEENKANAKRIVQSWNNFDRLLKACKEGLRALKEADDKRLFQAIVVMEELKQAIAETEGE